MTTSRGIWSGLLMALLMLMVVMSQGWATNMTVYYPANGSVFTADGVQVVYDHDNSTPVQCSHSYDGGETIQEGLKGGNNGQYPYETNFYWGDKAGWHTLTLTCGDGSATMWYYADTGIVTKFSDVYVDGSHQTHFKLNTSVNFPTTCVASYDGINAVVSRGVFPNEQIETSYVIQSLSDGIHTLDLYCTDTYQVITTESLLYVIGTADINVSLFSVKPNYQIVNGSFNTPIDRQSLFKIEGAKILLSNHKDPTNSYCADYIDGVASFPSTLAWSQFDASLLINKDCINKNITYTNLQTGNTADVVPSSEGSVQSLGSIYTDTSKAVGFFVNTDIPTSPQSQSQQGIATYFWAIMRIAVLVCFAGGIILSAVLSNGQWVVPLVVAVIEFLILMVLQNAGLRVI